MLLSFAVKRGRVFPSLDTIARMAMCSKSTVLNAIAWLELYGFIDKLRRIVRTTGLLGPRDVQRGREIQHRTHSALHYGWKKLLGSFAPPLHRLGIVFRDARPLV